MAPRCNSVLLNGKCRFTRSPTAGWALDLFPSRREKLKLFDLEKAKTELDTSFSWPSLGSLSRDHIGRRPRLAMRQKCCRAGRIELLETRIAQSRNANKHFRDAVKYFRAKTIFGDIDLSLLAYSLAWTLKSMRAFVRVACAFMTASRSPTSIASAQIVSLSGLGNGRFASHRQSETTTN